MTAPELLRLADLFEQRAMRDAPELLNEYGVLVESDEVVAHVANCFVIAASLRTLSDKPNGGDGRHE